MWQTSRYNKKGAGVHARNSRTWKPGSLVRTLVDYALQLPPVGDIGLCRACVNPPKNIRKHIPFVKERGFQNKLNAFTFVFRWLNALPNGHAASPKRWRILTKARTITIMPMEVVELALLTDFTTCSEQAATMLACKAVALTTQRMQPAVYVSVTRIVRMKRLVLSRYAEKLLRGHDIGVALKYAYAGFALQHIESISIAKMAQMPFDSIFDDSEVLVAALYHAAISVAATL